MIRAMAWSPDGSRLAVGTNDQPMGPRGGGSVYILDAATGAVVHRLTASEPIEAVAWSESGIAAGMSSASLVTPTVTLQVRMVPGSEIVFQAEGIHQVDSLSWSPIDNRLAVGRNDGLVQVWNVARGMHLHSMQVDGRKTKPTAQTRVNALEWSPDGTMLATGSDDGYLRIWGGTTFTLAKEDFNPDYVSDISWSSDGDSIVVGCANGEVLIWSVK